jgi:ACS family pantothenate transporter-like MFS transporter
VPVVIVLTTVPLYFLFAAQLGQTTGSMIFWVKSYNVKGQPPVFSVAAINIIPLGVGLPVISQDCADYRST